MARTNNHTVLITRPNDDLTTNHLFYWAGLIVSLAKRKGLTVLDLAGKRANRKNFESYLRKKSPGIIVFNGHGSPSVITGHNQEILVDTKNSSQHLVGALIYARSCKAGQVLGKVLVKKGAKAFIGYARDFVFACDEKYTTKPINDPLAKLFLEPSNLVPIAFIKGNTAQQSHNKSKVAMRKNVRYMLSSEASEKERSSAVWLWSNYTCQKLIE